MTIRNAERRPSAHKPLVLAAALHRVHARPWPPANTMQRLGDEEWRTATMVPPPAPQPTRAATPAPAPSPTTAPTPVSAVDVKGEAIYQASCAACHDRFPETTRAPSKEQLRAMSLQFINYSLTAGKMQTQGKKLSPEDRGTLINYLSNAPALGGTNKIDPNWATQAMCSGRPARRRPERSGRLHRLRL